MSHIGVVSSYGIDLQAQILQEGQHNEKYMELRHRLQQSTNTSTSASTSIGARDVGYCLMVDGLFRFRDRIYVPHNSEFKKAILREFHVKLYSAHP